jgi:3-deoxy-D-manno-octulosonate 8-phosphate phosphatase (KDO 8-P phosphatase)
MPYNHLADLPADIRERARRVRLACFDVDGVMTDGQLWFGDDGREWKAFHAQDGLGLKLLQSTGVAIALVTARSSSIVARRAQELGLAHVHQGVRDKLAEVRAIAAGMRLELDAVCYVGDDVPDLAAIQSVGLGIAVANAHAWVRERARWRTQKAGGEGAVREVCDLLMGAQGTADGILARHVAT